MFIVHLALGGCLKAPPVDFGRTTDTGGHIAYVLDAAAAQVRNAEASRVVIVTRLFDDPVLGQDHSRVDEPLANGLVIHRIETANRGYLEKGALAAEVPALTEAFCAYLARLDALPDVIHAHFADAAAIAVEARRRFGVPYVYTPHALGIDKRSHGLADHGLAERIERERRAIETADAIIVSTRDEAERQVDAYGVATAGRIACLPPGVPQRAPDQHNTLVDRLGDWLNCPGLPIILAIARPVAKKNLSALLRAYAGDAALREQANLVVLAGQDSNEANAVVDTLRALAQTPGLRGRVALPPAHSAADVTALYRRAAAGGVFVNPALHEPFGLTLIEAAAAGVPVVATRNGGPGEIVATIGHGLLVDPQDESAIAAACRAVMEDPALHARLAAAAVANVGRYDWDRYAADTLTLYAGLGVAPKLLVCDIDNTLTGCAEGARAFADWHRTRAMPFIVATGRSYAAARAILAKWRLPMPEAFIVDVGTRIMRPDGETWSECKDYSAVLDRGWDRDAVARALAPLGLAPQPEDTAGPHKLSFFGGTVEAERARAALQLAGLAARVVWSHGRLIDVLAPAGGKAAAVAAYAKGRGTTLAACVAAGDSGNDLDMLDACGHAIVVGNASDELATLRERPGLLRVTRHHAAGVIEGLDLLGLASRSMA